MKKILLLMFLLATTVAFSETQPSYNQLKSTIVTQITQAKITSLLTITKKITICDSLAVNEAIAFPSDAIIDFVAGGKLVIASGASVAFNGPFN